MQRPTIPQQYTYRYTTSRIDIGLTNLEEHMCDCSLNFTLPFYSHQRKSSGSLGVQGWVPESWPSRPVRNWGPSQSEMQVAARRATRVWLKMAEGAYVQEA